MLKFRLSKRLPKKRLLKEKLSSRDRRTSSWKWPLLLKRRLRKKKEGNNKQ